MFKFMSVIGFGIVLGATSLSSAALATGTTTIWKVVNIAPGGYLYVYSGPSIKTKVVKKLRKNDKVLMEEYTYGGTCVNGKTGEDYSNNIPSPNVWCRVGGPKMNGKEGFVYTRYLKYVGIYQ